METQNWYFSYPTKGVYSLHKEMTLQNRHTVIALQQDDEAQLWIITARRTSGKG